MGSILDNLVITVKHVSGTSREVADRARTTIGLGEGDKPISDHYMRKMYLCEHSPIRTQQYLVKMENIPYWVAMHFRTHWLGMECFISTSRTDRTGVDRNEKKQSDCVNLEIYLNPQAFINVSRKRLCTCASLETRQVWQKVLRELERINKPLADCCVADCIYRGHCYEHKSCNWHKTRDYRFRLVQYKDLIN